MINLQVRSGIGDILARGACGMEWTNDFQRLSGPEFPLLGGLLPYVDTVFNRRQVGMLRNELDLPVAHEVLGDAVVAEIIRLCADVEEEPHRYLWFVGD